MLNTHRKGQLLLLFNQVVTIVVINPDFNNRNYTFLKPSRGRAKHGLLYQRTVKPFRALSLSRVAEISSHKQTLRVLSDAGLRRIKYFQHQVRLISD